MFLNDSSSDDSLAALRASPGVLVFGAGAIGLEVIRACGRSGITVAAVCDNSPKKWGETVLDVEILSPEEGASRNPKAECIVAVAACGSVEALCDQLGALGFSRGYGAQIARRFFEYGEPPTYKNNGFHIWDAVQKAAWCHDRYGRGDGRPDILESLSCFITEQCSLRCRNCSIFLPHFQKRAHYSLGGIKDDIDKVCSGVDGIETFILLGGEAFLHPDFSEIVRYSTGKKEIFQVLVITNGTLLPNEQQWEALRSDKVFFAISNYGELSRCLEQLTQELEKHGIKGVVFPQTQWLNNELVDAQGISESKLRDIYAHCAWTSCYSLAEGKITRCAPALYGMKLGRIPDYPGDYVDLRADVEEETTLRRRIRKYMKETSYLNSCGHCKAWRDGSPEMVSAAEQICTCADKPGSR